MAYVSEDQIIKMVELQLGKGDVKNNDRLVEDLGAESADIANLVAAIEEKHNIVVKESEIARIFTSADLFSLVQTHFNEP